MLTQKDKKCRINKKNNHERKDDIIIPKESKLEKDKVEIEKKNKLPKYIPTDNITKLNKFIYAGAKVVSDKIGILLRKPDRNTNTLMENKLRGQIIKLQQQVKLLRKTKCTETQWNKKTKKRTTADKSESMTKQTAPSKIMNENSTNK